MSPADESERQFLRHAVATVAYRAGKALRGAPESFARGQRVFARLRRSNAHWRSSRWASAIARGENLADSQPLEWSREVERFFAALKKFDDYLASDEPLHAPSEKLFQGPIADSLTHVGQIAMLRRLANCPVKGENYFFAKIEAGKVGQEQAAPRREFE
jgi:hypothetical protein